MTLQNRLQYLPTVANHHFEGGITDAASIHAYLLIYAQANNFPFNDGHFAQAYFVNAASSTGAYITPAAFPFYFYTSAVGDQAWAGMALSQLFWQTASTTCKPL